MIYSLQHRYAGSPNKQKEEQGTVEQDLKIGKEMISQVTLYTTFQLQIVTKG